MAHPGEVDSSGTTARILPTDEALTRASPRGRKPRKETEETTATTAEQTNSPRQLAEVMRGWSEVTCDADVICRMDHCTYFRRASLVDGDGDGDGDADTGAGTIVESDPSVVTRAWQWRPRGTVVVNVGQLVCTWASSNEPMYVLAIFKHRKCDRLSVKVVASGGPRPRDMEQMPPSDGLYLPSSVTEDSAAAASVSFQHEFRPFVLPLADLTFVSSEISESWSRPEMMMAAIKMAAIPPPSSGPTAAAVPVAVSLGSAPVGSLAHIPAVVHTVAPVVIDSTGTAVASTSASVSVSVPVTVTVPAATLVQIPVPMPFSLAMSNSGGLTNSTSDPTLVDTIARALTSVTGQQILASPVSLPVIGVGALSGSTGGAVGGAKSLMLHVSDMEARARTTGSSASASSLEYRKEAARTRKEMDFLFKELFTNQSEHQQPPLQQQQWPRAPKDVADDDGAISDHGATAPEMEAEAEVELSPERGEVTEEEAAVKERQSPKRTRKTGKRRRGSKKKRHS